MIISEKTTALRVRFLKLHPFCGNGKVQKYQGANISVRKQRAYKLNTDETVRCLF